MLSILGRASLVSGAALLALIGTSLAPGHSATGSGAALAAPRLHGNGISAVAAARALNALSAVNTAHVNKPMTDVHFILNWLPNVEFAGLWMAEKQKLWEKAGIKMTFTPWSNSVHPELDVPARGGLTFGFQSGAAIAIARAKGEKITALYTDTQKSVFGLEILKKSHITNLKQLKGKRVGYQSDELYVPQTMLANVGLKQSDWTAIPVGFNIDELTGGRVDAYLVFVTNEPIDLQMRHVAAVTFPAYKYGFHFYDDVMFTYDGLIQRNPKLVSTVTGIVARAFQYGHTHPAETAKYVTSTTFTVPKAKAAQNLDQQTREIKAFAPYSADARGRYTGVMNTAYWRDSINTLYKYHLISTKPSPSAIYTNRFNPYR